jgi:hypothetical protein
MTNVQSYLGISKLTSEYDGYFFDDNNIKLFKIRVGKILKNSEDEIVFITSEKFESRVYSIRVLKRHEGVPYVSNWVDMKFPSSDEAIAYYKKESKQVSSRKSV